MEKSNGSKGRYLLRQLSQHYRIHKVDIGEDARMAKRGFVFVTRTYEIEDVGHLCIMNMKTMFGLMRMETVILASTKKDMPLMNLDWVQVPGKQTLLGELYDTQLTPWPEESQAAFARISDRDHDLPDYSSGSEHWYDSLLYPCSYHKTGRGIGSRLEEAAALYEQLGNYQRAPALLRQLRYRMAENAVTAGDYDLAILLYSDLGNYMQSRARLKNARYQKAARLYEQNSFQEALEIFESLENYEDSRRQVLACRYAMALETEAREDWESAITAFEALEDYEDSAQHLSACRYALAKRMLSEGMPLEAAAALDELGDYEDAAELARQASLPRWAISRTASRRRWKNTISRPRPPSRRESRKTPSPSMSWPATMRTPGKSWPPLPTWSIRIRRKPPAQPARMSSGRMPPMCSPAWT